MKECTRFWQKAADLEPFLSKALSAIKSDMNRSEPPSFHVRLPAELKARLEASKGRGSLNREIVRRLERSFEPDSASELAEAMRPVLAALNDEDRTFFVRHFTKALSALGQAGGRARRQKG